MGRTNCITTELSQKTHWSEVGEEGEKEFQQKEQHQKVKGMNTTWSAEKKQEGLKLSPGTGSLKQIGSEENGNLHLILQVFN